MSLFLKFDDIENDDDRARARKMYEELRGQCSCTDELLELRHDIIKAIIDKPSPYYAPY